MAKKIILSVFLGLVLLTASVYFILNDEVRIDIQKTKSIFQVKEDGDWILSGVEYVNLFDGSAKMRASSRYLDTEIGDNNITTVTRVAYYKENISTIEIYTFNPGISDVEFFPINHSIEVINGEDKILQYEVHKLFYIGETTWNIKSPQSFGHKMKVEWDDGNYYSRIYKYKNKDEGKLTIKYRIDSANYLKNVRLFDPPEDITVTLNSPEDNFEAPPNGSVVFNCSADSGGNLSLFTNESGVWSAKNTTNASSDSLNLISYYRLDGTPDPVIDSFNYKNGTNSGATSGGVGKIGNSYLFDGSTEDSFNSRLNSEIVNTNWSLSFWINDTNIGTSQFIMGQRESETANYWYIQLHINGSIHIGSEAMAVEQVSPQLLTANVWHHIVLTVAANDIKIYLDNVVVITDTSCTLLSTASDRNISFGRWYDGWTTDNGMDGHLDEIGIWNRTLSATEISSFYNDGDGKRPSDSENISGVWTRTISASTLWTCESCNQTGTCVFADTNRTIDVDTLIPNVTIIYPDNTTYSTEISELNYSVVESNPDKCWYSVDDGLTNLSTVSSGTNFTSVVSVEGSNTWKVYCNDTKGQEGYDNLSFIKDTGNPQIDYTASSDISNNSGDFGIKDWVFINVSVSDFFISNVTFWTWTSTNSSFNKTVFTNNASTYQLNQTGLSEDVYFWNVTACDSLSQCNTTDIRYYGLEVVNFSIDNISSNQIVELGTDLNISATSTFDYVLVDVDHPSYGTNYSSGLFSTTFELIINWFRKTVFSDDTTSKKLEYTGTEIKNVSIYSHQYAEVVNMSINISGTNTTKYPENVQINSTNTSTIDRFFPGLLIEDNIFLDRDANNDSEINLTYTNKGPQSINMYMDDGSIFGNMTFNITGLEFGVDFLDNLINDTYIDMVKTTGQLDKSGIIMSANSSLANILYDDFEDGSVNTAIWHKTADASGSGDGYSFSRTISETGGYLQMLNTVSNPGNVITGDSVLNFMSNSSFLNLRVSESIQFKLYNSHSSNADNTRCSADTRFYLGESEVWDVTILRDSDVGSNQVESGVADILFNVIKHNSTHWRVQISGIETSYVAVSGGCGDRYIVVNWSNGSSLETKEYCADEFKILENDSFYPITYGSSQPFWIYNMIGVDTINCEANTMDTRLYFVNTSLWNRQNGSVISKSVYDSSSTITEATLSATGAQVDNEVVTFYMSADDGDNWEAVTNGVEHSFVNAGSHLKWKTDFNMSVAGYKNLSSFVESMNITTPKGFPTNISIDFGNDGVADFTFTGELNNTNSPMFVNVSSANLATSLAIDPVVGNHLNLIPLEITSDTVGQINIDTLSFFYNPNPIKLALDAISNFINSSIGFVNFSILIESMGGNITVDDVKFDYAGGNDTISVTAHNNDSSRNLTRNITYYYSRWDYEWGPDNVEWIYFAPGTNTSVNITPYGQTSDTSIINITNYGYGGKNATLSVYENGLLACVNTTISLNSTKDDGFLLKESFINLTELEYLEVAEIYLWADYNCSYDTWHLFEPQYYFRQCVNGSICSTDLI